MHLVSAQVIFYSRLYFWFFDPAILRYPSQCCLEGVYKFDKNEIKIQTLRFDF